MRSWQHTVTMVALSCLAYLGTHAVQAVEAPVQIRVSGVLAQSQPAKTMPLPFVGTFGGVSFDKTGKLWTAYDNQAYGLTRHADQSWEVSERIQLPTSITHLGTRWDGQKIFASCWDWRIHAVDPIAKTCSPICTIDDNTRSFAVAPAGLTSGYAGKAKIFTLVGDTVKAYTENGAALGIVLTVPRATGMTTRFDAVGIEPTSGDLLVGTGYPDMRIYRFDVQGNQVTTGGWPRRGSASSIHIINDTAWLVNDGGAAKPLQSVQTGNDEDMAIPSYWSMYAFGINEDPVGGYWLSTSQGLVHFDRNGQPTQERLGGLSDVKAMRIGADGTLIVLIERGERVARLNIADAANTPFQSNSNEPWRVAANWSDRGKAIAWDGKAYIILDVTSKQLWSFDPNRQQQGEKNWVKMSEPNVYSDPRCMAAGNALIWVVDGKQLLEGTQTPTGAFHVVQLPSHADMSDVSDIAAGPQNMLYFASTTTVWAYTRDANGVYRQIWQSNLVGKNLVSLDATTGFVVVADKDAQSISVLSPTTGRVLGQLTADRVDGGMMPVCVASSSKWIIVADEQGKRLIRLRVVAQ